MPRRTLVISAMPRRTLVIAALAVAGAVAIPSAGAHRLPKAPGCPVLPSSNAFNQRVDRLPVAANSQTLVSSIGLDARIHADFGSGTYEGGPIGIPYAVVRKSQKRVPVSFEYAGESDRGHYPIPPNVPIEGGPNAGGDRHVLVVDRDRCRLYELYDAHPRDGGTSWTAGSGAIFDLRSNRLRPAGWTSADAAGLPILPGLARYHEVAEGSIDHALRFTARRTRRAYVRPARHFASDSGDPALPPMGTRVRLKANVDLAGLGRQARIVARALKRYGALLADNGSPWYFSGAPDRRWDDDDLHTLDRLSGTDFEVVDTRSLPRPR
ncbi:MAG: hypothetical protein QOI73_2590 [Solirubrobacteraceae bacterium]|nr:hypothetical protein [Solirubrobacteraceae bacterium]